MQAIVANVMADQGQTRGYTASGGSYAMRDMELNATGGEDRSFAVNSRANSDVINDALGTGLHEFTHVSSGVTYNNTGMLLTYGKHLNPAQIQAERDERIRAMTGISESVGTGQWTASESLSDFVMGQSDYALGIKAGQYVTGEKTKLLRDLYADSTIPATERADLSTNHAATQAVVPQPGSTTSKYQQHRDQYLAAPGGTAARKDRVRSEDESMATYMGAVGNQVGSSALVEYDPVINQMLVQYEQASTDRTSQYYRRLKAAALRSHVQRHNQRIRNRTAPL